MRKTLITLCLLLVFGSLAQASPVQITFGTAPGSVAPTYFYGMEMTLQLPVGISPAFDPMSPGKNLIDPNSISILNNSHLTSNTLVTAFYTPSTIITKGGLVTIALSNANGLKYGILMDLRCNFLPSFVPTYDTNFNVNNVIVRIQNSKLFDANGAEIPSTSAYTYIFRTYVWMSSNLK